MWRCGDAWRGTESWRSAEICSRMMQRDLEMWDGQSHIHVWWIEVRRDTSGARDPSPRPDYPAQDSNTRKISPHNFWL